jgi:hypothetical protein
VSCRRRLSSVVILTALAIVGLAAPEARREIDPALVKSLVKSELAAARLRLTSSTCLGLERHRGPSDRLLDTLRAEGLPFRKASKCVKSLDGILVTVGAARIHGDRAEVPVEIADMTLEPGSHFATLLPRGLYNAWTRRASGP